MNTENRLTSNTDNSQDVKVTSKGDRIKLVQSVCKYGSNVQHTIELDKTQVAKLVKGLANWLDS